jgi:hypothetical protein
MEPTPRRVACRVSEWICEEREKSELKKNLTWSRRMNIEKRSENRSTNFIAFLTYSCAFRVNFFLCVLTFEILILADFLMPIKFQDFFVANYFDKKFKFINFHSKTLSQQQLLLYLNNFLKMKWSNGIYIYISIFSRVCSMYFKIRYIYIMNILNEIFIEIK